MRTALQWSVDLSNTFYHREAVLTMTTNEIAAAAQRGQAGLLELWEAVRRFAYDKAYRWQRAADGRGGTALEDLMQCAFLAMTDAVETWRAESGAFLTWYGLQLKSAFTAATGQHTQRAWQEPLDRSLSLDAPLSDNEGEPFTLADVLEDPNAAAEIDMVTERDFQKQRREALRRALQILPEDQKRAVVGRYCWGQKTDLRACGAGLRTLRRPAISRELRQYC